jgi:hypothetical protein
VGPGGRTAVGALAFLLAISVVGWRIYHRLDVTTPPWSEEAALIDYRDAVYYPVVAFLDGENPYDHARVVARYPINNTIGLYSPMTLLLHLPLGFLPYRVSEVAYVAASMLLMVVLAVVAWRVNGHVPDAAMVLGLAAVLVITRPGHWNLVLGQVSLPAALATIAALWLAPTRPWLAGLGFAVATFKPTYGLPLFVLLAIRREWRALTIGVVLAGVLTMIPLGIIIARAGVDGFVQAVLHQYGTRMTTPIMSPVQSTFRVDVVGLVARHLGRVPTMVPTLLLSGSVLAVAAAGLWRLPPDDEPARRLGLTIASLALILCTYHQEYDLPLLAPMLVATWPLRPFRPSAWPLVCIAVPFLNYIATGGFQRATGIPDAQIIWVSSVNIVALLAAFALVVRQAFQYPRPS